MELDQDEVVVIRDDSNKIIWRGSRDGGFDVARRMSELNPGQRYNVVQMKVIGTHYHDPNLREEHKVLVFPPRPPQPI